MLATGLPDPDGPATGTREPSTIRVLVADDHPLFREALTRAIAEDRDLQVVGHAASAPDAIARVEALRPHVAVLDVRMPGDGREVLHHVRARELETLVLFLSEYVDSQSVLSAMTAGASGYLGKGVRGEEIRAAIREVARGGSALSTEAQRALLAGLRAREAAENSPLTERELQMLELIAGGLSNAEVAAQLVVSPETVKSHLRNLYGKLEVSDRAAAVAEALRRGLID